MLASPKSRKVLETIFDAALDDDHKNQAAAWKLVMDRILPVGAFEKDIMKDAGRNAIQINISGVSSVDVGNRNAIQINISGVSSVDVGNPNIIEGEVVDES
jgi:hypothetical protein